MTSLTQSSPPVKAGPAPAGSAWRRGKRELATAGVFLFPFLALTLLFQYIPLAVLARDSVHRYTLFNPDAAEFVGFDNFTRIFEDPATMRAFLVTLGFMVGFLMLTVPAGFLLAVYLNTRFPGRGIVRTLVFLPVVTSVVVVSTMWAFILNQSGLVNSVLAGWGIPPIGFFTDPALALPSIVLLSAWQQVGLAAVIFLGGLQSIPDDVMEAAAIDGAGAVRRLVSITLPLVSRTTVLVVVVMTVFAIQAFAPAYIITSGGPVGSTNLLMFHIYRTAFFIQQPGFASAMSLVLLVFALTVSVIQMRLLRTTWSY